MKNTITAAALLFLPGFAQAVTYSADGAIMLEGEPVSTTSNIIAAVGGANLSLTCLATLVLMIVSIFILHELWHPQRVHDQMTYDEIKRESVKFYIGGSLVWVLIAILAESWCVILPLILIMAAGLIYYLVAISTASDDELQE